MKEILYFIRDNIAGIIAEFIAGREVRKEENRYLDSLGKKAKS